MATTEDGPQPTRARQKLSELRITLQDARNADDAERIHVALIEVVDGLIAHAERQSRAIDEMRSDLGHKQGIVTKFDGGEFHEPRNADRLLEFASSANGDQWFLGRDDATGIARVVHKANIQSGGAVTHIELGVFLNQGPSAPEMLGLLRLIGGLVA